MSYFESELVEVGGGRIGLALTHTSGETAILTNYPSMQVAGELWKSVTKSDLGTEYVVYVTYARIPRGGRRRLADSASIADGVRAVLSGREWWTDEEAQALAESAVSGRAALGR